MQGPSAGPAGAEGAAAPAIELAELRRDFGDLPALSGVSLTLPAGQSLAVLGPNGSGKSTLLRILAGLLRPSGGAVSVLGCSLPKETYGLRGRVGYLGHEPLLYRDLTPRENLALVAALHGIEAERRIDELLEAVRMSHRADDRVAELSAGMRQRIDICRAVLHEPELLLLDEPMAGMNHDEKGEISRFILDVNRELQTTIVLIEPLIATGRNRTRVVVSHDREAALAGADGVLELR